MPLYEYACAGCGKTFEELVLEPADEPQTCANCGRRGPQKIISVPSPPKFKGPGFYATEYGKG